MDFTDTLWMGTGEADCDRQAYHRRDIFEREWLRGGEDVLISTRDDQETGDVIERRERLAEAMYEC